MSNPMVKIQILRLSVFEGKDFFFLSLSPIVFEKLEEKEKEMIIINEEEAKALNICE